MSTRIDGTRIYMTRGDTPTFEVKAIIASTGTEYTLEAGDKIYFRLKKTPYMEDVILTKEVVSGQLTMAVDDTKALSFGKYYYCLELVTANGYHETFVEPTEIEGAFTIGKELEDHA